MEFTLPTISVGFREWRLSAPRQWGLSAHEPQAKCEVLILPPNDSALVVGWALNTSSTWKCGGRGALSSVLGMREATLIAETAVAFCPEGTQLFLLSANAFSRRGSTAAFGTTTLATGGTFTATFCGGSCGGQTTARVPF